MTKSTPRHFQDLIFQTQSQVKDTVNELVDAVAEGRPEIGKRRNDVDVKNAQVLKYRTELRHALLSYKEWFMSQSNVTIHEFWRKLAHYWLPFVSRAMYIIADERQAAPHEFKNDPSYLCDNIRDFCVISESYAAIDMARQVEVKVLMDCMRSILVNLVQHLYYKYFSRINDPQVLGNLIEKLQAVKTHLHGNSLKRVMHILSEMESLHLSLQLNNSNQTKDGIDTFVPFYTARLITYRELAHNLVTIEDEPVKRGKNLEPVELAAQRARDGQAMMYYYATSLEKAEQTIAPGKVHVVIEKNSGNLSASI